MHHYIDYIICASRTTHNVHCLSLIHIIIHSIVEVKQLQEEVTHLADLVAT